MFHEYECVSKKLNTQPGTAKAIRRMVNNARDIGQAAGGKSKNPKHTQQALMQVTHGTNKSPKLTNYGRQNVSRLLKRMWTSRYYLSVKHEGRCMYQMTDPADLQKICAFSKACKFSHGVITLQSVRVQSQYGRQKK